MIGGGFRAAPKLDLLMRFDNDPNESFLHERPSGTSLEALLAPP